MAKIYSNSVEKLSALLVEIHLITLDSQQRQFYIPFELITNSTCLLATLYFNRHNLVQSIVWLRLLNIYFNQRPHKAKLNFATFCWGIYIYKFNHGNTQLTQDDSRDSTEKQYIKAVKQRPMTSWCICNWIIPELILFQRCWNLAFSLGRSPF